jgi:hypothetical protein
MTKVAFSFLPLSLTSDNKYLTIDIRGLESVEASRLSSLRLIEDVNASAQRDMSQRGLMDTGVRQVDLPALLHQRTQRIDDSIALVERATLA